jgi:hypothetical protein
MGYLERLLASNEKIIRLAHDHWIVLLATILVDAVLIVIILGLSATSVVIATPWSWLGLLLLALPLGHIGFRLVEWWNNRYIVTNRRIIQLSGTFNTRVSDTSLEKINDIVMEQSPLGRILNFGRLEIISGSNSGTDIFPRLADPIGFKKDVLDQKDALAGRGGWGQDQRQLRDKETRNLIAGLEGLRRAGILTAAEFEEKKQRVLDKVGKLD